MISNDSKRVEFPTFECYWCKEDIGDGSEPHDCPQTPKIRIAIDPKDDKCYR